MRALETEINNLKIIISDNETKILDLESRNLAQEERIAQKTDVEVQLAAALDREKSNVAARD